MPPSLSHISMCFLALSPATRTGLSGPSTYKSVFQNPNPTVHLYCAKIQIAFKERLRFMFAYRLQLPTVVNQLTHPVLKIVCKSFGVKHNKTMSLKLYFNLIIVFYKRTINPSWISFKIRVFCQKVP